MQKYTLYSVLEVKGILKLFWSNQKNLDLASGYLCIYSNIRPT